MRRRVAAGLVLLATLAPASARAAIHVYATAWNTGQVDEYRGGPSGALTEFGHPAGGTFNPWYMVMTSNARNLYLDRYVGQTLEAFSVGPAGGLTHKSSGGSAMTGSRPYALAISPDNRSIYVPNYDFGGPSTVSIFDVAADGSLKQHDPPTIASGDGPEGAAVSRDGKSVYVAAQDGNIYQFNRAADGSLTKKSPAFVTVKNLSDVPQPDYLVLTPDGQHLYSANYNDGSVGIFDVHPDGTLAEKAGSPVAGGEGFYEIAMAPNGKSLYGASNADGMVYQWTIDPNGTLVKKSPWKVAAGASLNAIWLSSDGRNAYAANEGTFDTDTNRFAGYDVRQFSIDAAGRLHAKTPPSVATDDYPAAVIVAPDQSPRAAFTSATAGVRKKQFDATGSKDPDGVVKRYVWRFGDGTGRLVDGPKPTHTYAHAGTYAVTLRVIDDAACSLARVWTGQTAYCGGSRAALVRHSVTVK